MTKSESADDISSRAGHGAGEAACNAGNAAVSAVILAAGRSSKFFAPLYDKPKGLFTFHGEVLVERQISQLRQAGIRDISVVVGYEKERFFYLEKAFGVSLATSTRYADEGNLSSLELVRDKLVSGAGAYVCAADHYYEANPFTGPVPQVATRLVQQRDDAREEFVATIDETGRIVSAECGAVSGTCLVGYAFFTPDFAAALLDLYDEQRDFLGVKAQHWEQFWARHARELPLYAAPAAPGFKEFDSLAQLQRLDANVLDNVSETALANICRLLECGKHDIRDIEPLNKGLTNVSFSFTVHGTAYVYRQPGASSAALVDRSAEVAAQKAACELGVDPSVLSIDEAGWKLSRYVESVREFDYYDDELLARGIAQLKRVHASGVVCEHETDLLRDGDELLRLASRKKGDLRERYEKVHTELVRLWHHVELDGVEKVLCHNDAYAPNWIVGAEDLCLIDWEYAGMNDPVNDVCTLTVRDGLDDATTERVLACFFDGPPSPAQRRHAYGYMALCAWYWFCWSLFKDTLGEDGFFMLTAWRALEKYLPRALSLYEQEECA